MKKIKNVESTVLKPKYETLKVDGEISYGEGNGAWNIIRLKRDILKEFPQLREKREKFDYSMIMHRSFDDLKKAIAEMETSEGVVPIFLFFRRKKQDL